MRVAVNPCPVWLVEDAWWVKRHDAKSRESINLKESKVLVKIMAVNHEKTMVGSVTQLEAPEMVSPSLVGRSVYRPSPPPMDNMAWENV